MTILIWHDKHGDAYWDASTAEKEGAAFVRYVEGLHEHGYLHDISGDEIHTQEKDIKGLSKRKEALEKGNDSTGVLKAEIKRLNTNIRYKEESLEETVRLSSILLVALDTKKWIKERGIAARHIAEMRADAEYEGWELVNVEDPLVK